MLKLTPSAKKYMRSVILNGDYVTLAVKGGGCSGLQYVWGLKNDLPDTIRWSAPIENVLVIDSLAEMYVIGSTIDFETELGGSFLKIVNHTESSSCGCGDSFNV